MSRCRYTTGTRLEQPLGEVPDAVAYFRRLARSRLNDGQRLHVQHLQQAVSRDLNSTFLGNAAPDPWSPWAGSPLAPPRIAREEGSPCLGYAGHLPIPVAGLPLDGATRRSCRRERPSHSSVPSPPGRAHNQMAVSGIGSNVVHELPADAVGNSIGHHGAGLYMAPETMVGTSAPGATSLNGGRPRTSSWCRRADE